VSKLRTGIGFGTRTVKIIGTGTEIETLIGKKYTFLKI